MIVNLRGILKLSEQKKELDYGNPRREHATEDVISFTRNVQQGSTTSTSLLDGGDKRNPIISFIGGTEFQSCGLMKVERTAHTEVHDGGFSELEMNICVALTNPIQFKRATLTPINLNPRHCRHLLQSKHGKEVFWNTKQETSSYYQSKRWEMVGPGKVMQLLSLYEVYLPDRICGAAKHHLFRSLASLCYTSENLSSYLRTLLLRLNELKLRREPISVSEYANSCCTKKGTKCHNTSSEDETENRMATSSGSSEPMRAVASLTGEITMVFTGPQRHVRQRRRNEGDFSMSNMQEELMRRTGSLFSLELIPGRTETETELRQMKTSSIHTEAVTVVTCSQGRGDDESAGFFVKEVVFTADESKIEVRLTCPVNGKKLIDGTTFSMSDDSEDTDVFTIMGDWLSIGPSLWSFAPSEESCTAKKNTLTFISQCRASAGSDLTGANTPDEFTIPGYWPSTGPEPWSFTSPRELCTVEKSTMTLIPHCRVLSCSDSVRAKLNFGIGTGLIKFPCEDEDHAHSTIGSASSSVQEVKWPRALGTRTEHIVVSCEDEGHAHSIIRSSSTSIQEVRFFINLGLEHMKANLFTSEVSEAVNSTGNPDKAARLVMIQKDFLKILSSPSNHRRFHKLLKTVLSRWYRRDSVSPYHKSDVAMRTAHVWKVIEFHRMMMAGSEWLSSEEMQIVFGLSTSTSVRHLNNFEDRPPFHYRRTPFGHESVATVSTFSKGPSSPESVVEFLRTLRDLWRKDRSLARPTQTQVRYLLRSNGLQNESIDSSVSLLLLDKLVRVYGVSVEKVLKITCKAVERVNREVAASRTTTNITKGLMKGKLSGLVKRRKRPLEDNEPSPAADSASSFEGSLPVLKKE